MNKLFIVSVICAVALATPADRQKRQAVICVDAFKNVPNPCTNNPSNQIYFPHPSDMSKFIQCDRYGRMYIIQCPENLEYSATTSTCRQTAAPVATNAPAAVTNSPVVAPANTNNPCTATALAAGNIYFSVSSDDNKFIECDMLGHANILACPTSLIWDESRLACVYKVGAGGAGGVVTVPTGTGTGTGTSGGSGLGNLKNPCTAATIAANKLFFTHPDPTKFIQCDLWGDVFVVSCPAGLVWNQYSETCASAFIQVNGAGK